MGMAHWSSSSSSSSSSCPCGRCATIKEKIGTPIIRSLIAISPKHVLVAHRAHRLVVDVQPGFASAATIAVVVAAGAPSHTAVPVRMEHVEGIVSTTSGGAVMIEHAVECVACGSSSGGCHDVWND
jgi:hypothetical protein